MPRATPPPMMPAEMFMAEVATENSIVYAGIRLEAFFLPESVEAIVVGARVRCLFVPEMQQVFVLDQAS